MPDTAEKETQPVKDKRLYDLEFAVKEVCFDKSLRPFPLFFMPKEMTEYILGFYSYSRELIMISRPYWEEHGVDAYTMSLMYHELCHAWNVSNGIEDTNGDYHNEHFKKTAEACGGICQYNNDEDGYNIVWLKKDTLGRIKAAYKAREKERQKRKDLFPEWYQKKYPELF